MTLATPQPSVDPTTAAFLLRLLCAVTLTWLAAAGAALVFRRTSAALRHRLWAMGTLTSLLLPGLIALLPEHRVGRINLTPPARPSVSTPPPVRTELLAPTRDLTDAALPHAAAPENAAAIPPARSTPAPIAPTLPHPVSPTPAPHSLALPSHRLLLLLALLPTLALLLRQAISLLAARRLSRHATPIADTTLLSTLCTRFHLRRTPRLLESEHISSPLCVGLLRPAILLPPAARAWPPGRFEAVMTHELAHVARRDVLWQTLSRLACAVYWCHPLAWVAAWRMRVERELACDDWVLRAGQSPTTYARHLLDIATTLTARHANRAPFAAVAMGSRTNFEHRIRAILDPARRRLAVTRRAAVLLTLATCALLATVGTLSPLAPRKATAAAPATATGTKGAPTANPDTARARVTGHVEDEQGHPIPNALVEAVTLPGRPSTHSDAAGRFTLEWPEAKIFVRLRAASADGTRLAIPQLHWNKPTADNPALTIDDLRIILKPAREFAVTVQDSAGKPVEGAWVAANCGFALGGEATTDAAGTARLRVPADAPILYVLASKPNAGFDYHLFWRKDEPRNDPYRLDPDFAGPLTFTLNGIKPVTVRVIDNDKRPLAGVQVYPWLIEKPKKGDDANLSGLTQYFRTTDANGEAHFDQIPIDQARSITFWTRLDGYCTVDRCIYDPKTAGPTIDTVMTPLLPVTGKVLDDQGQPAAGATVKVAGTGYTFDSFREQTKTGPDGTFRIGVNPNMYYMFAAQLGGDDPDKPRLISTPHVQVILTQAPAPVELKLGPAIRVFGRATAGPDHAPIPKANVVAQQRDESYFKLPKDQKLPNPKDSHRAISVMLPVWQTTGDDGAYEFFLAPGEYDVYRSGAPSNGRPKPLTLTAGQTEVEYNLYSPDARPSAKPNILKGRVVRADDPKVGVPEAAIEGHHVKLDPVFVRGVSAKDGAFALRRGESDLVLFAATPDKKLAGITLVKSTDDTATLPLGPTASATGRLLDHDGRPAAGRRIDYGTRIGPPKGPFIDAFGGTTTTADDGTFTVTGLVPGYEYHLNPVEELDSDGHPRRWSTAGTTKPDRAEQLHLGDRKMPKPYTPPTPADYITQSFSHNQPLDQRLDKARHTAQACYQNVLVILAAPDRAPLRRFFEHWRDDQEYDVWNAFAEYVTVFVNVDTADAKTRAWADANHIPWPADKDAMTFAVLDETGHLLATAPAAPLLAAGDAKAQRARLIEFAKKSARPLPDAQKLLDDALARAKREDKRVLLDQTGALCGWCVRLHDYLEGQRHLIDKDYVTVVLDSRMPHGRDLLKRLRSGNEEDQGSTPWMAILDADGKTLATSDGPKGNIGYPGEAEGQAHWEQMLRSTAKRLTPEEIQSLLLPLRKPGGL